MKTIKLLTITAVFFGLSQAATASQFNSAHSCQVLGSVSQVAYHGAGVIIALSNNVRVSCPLSSYNLNGSLNARVYFNSKASQPSGNKIKCHITKTYRNDTSLQGSPRAAGIRVIDKLVLRNSHSRAGAVGANILCQMQRGTKLLGIEMY